MAALLSMQEKSTEGLIENDQRRYKKGHAMKSRVFVLVGVFLLVIVGCASDNSVAPPAYYEFAFDDEVAAIVAGDTVNVLLLQTAPKYPNGHALPFAVIAQTGLGDTVRIRMHVQYGGYRMVPDPQRGLALVGDTLRVHYGLVGMSGKLVKSAGSSAVTTSPLPTYYSVDSVTIFSAPDKLMGFGWRQYP